MCLLHDTHKTRVLCCSGTMKLLQITMFLSFTWKIRRSEPNFILMTYDSLWKGCLTSLPLRHYPWWRKQRSAPWNSRPIDLYTSWCLKLCRHGINVRPFTDAMLEHDQLFAFSSLFETIALFFCRGHCCCSLCFGSTFWRSFSTAKALWSSVFRIFSGWMNGFPTWSAHNKKHSGCVFGLAGVCWTKWADLLCLENDTLQLHLIVRSTETECCITLL